MNPLLDKGLSVFSIVTLLNKALLYCIGSMLFAGDYEKSQNEIFWCISAQNNPIGA